MNASRAVVLVCAVIGLLRGTADATVTIVTVPVGNPGNAGQLSGSGAGGMGPNRVCGSVSYTYSIGKYEVTAGQYAEFLNSVAKTDIYGLYNPDMANISRDASHGYGCNIQRSSDAGSYVYTVPTDYANRPVNHVSYWDACRFVNWLNNGQPVGSQGASTTERGAYTLDGYTGGDGRAIQRNAGARWVLPTEDEWYKAAYYDPSKPGGAGYWLYPTCSDTITPSMANYGSSFINHTTDVDAYAGYPGPYGTLDQAGNLAEWDETALNTLQRSQRGGYFRDASFWMVAPKRTGYYPSSEKPCVGFRVAYVPEPGTLMMLVLAGSSFQRKTRT